MLTRLKITRGAPYQISDKVCNLLWPTVCVQIKGPDRHRVSDGVGDQVCDQVWRLLQNALGEFVEEEI